MHTFEQKGGFIKELCFQTFSTKNSDKAEQQTLRHIGDPRVTGILKKSFCVTKKIEFT